MCEHITPFASSPSRYFESAHLLHAVDFAIIEAHLRVLPLKSISDRPKICRPKLFQHTSAIVMTKCKIVAICCAGISRSQGIGTQVSCLWDNNEFRNTLPIQA